TAVVHGGWCLQWQQRTLQYPRSPDFWRWIARDLVEQLHVTGDGGLRTGVVPQPRLRRYHRELGTGALPRGAGAATGTGGTTGGHAAGGTGGTGGRDPRDPRRSRRSGFPGGSVDPGSGYPRGAVGSRGGSTRPGRRIA